MTTDGWLQIALLFAVVLLTAAPLGGFMARVYAGERNLLTPILGPVERLLYHLAGADPATEQNWLGYTLGMLAFNAAGFLLLSLLLRLQDVLPLNPQGFPGVAPDLAFDTDHLIPPQAATRIAQLLERRWTRTTAAAAQDPTA